MPPRLSPGFPSKVLRKLPPPANLARGRQSLVLLTDEDIKGYGQWAASLASRGIAQ